MTQPVNIDFNFAPTTTTFTSTGVFSANPSGSVNYSEDGVNYTLSIANGDGSNFAAIYLSSSSATLTLFNGSGAVEDFIFDVNNGTELSFGNFSIIVSSATGWTLNGVALVHGNNVFTGQFSALTFSNSTANETLYVTSINAIINCFCADTMIATPTGPRAVQDLAVGDVISTASGGTTTVKWLGEQAVNVRLTNPTKVNPICISAGALGAGLPVRDLTVSQDHAIEIDGMLINAGALVNGGSIYQVAQMPLDGFSYYHIDTGAHELLLAEGVSAESFVDYASRDSFEGTGTATSLIPEMPLPRISSARMVPAAIKAKLNIGRKQVA